jgi:hypothetical protein
MAPLNEQVGAGTSDTPTAANDPAVREFKRSQAVKLFAIAAVCLAGVAALVAYFISQRIPDLTEARFEAAQKLWELNGPASYDLDLIIRGAQPGSVHLEVRDGEPTAMTRDGVAPPERTWDTWTVPGQFETLEEEFAIAADPTHKGQGAPGAQVWLWADFDSQYGYPSVYHRVITFGGPEVFWRVTKFEPK